jgi:hypothetical protein
VSRDQLNTRFGAGLFEGEVAPQQAIPTMGLELPCEGAVTVESGRALVLGKPTSPRAPLHDTGPCEPLR